MNPKNSHQTTQDTSQDISDNWQQAVKKTSVGIENAYAARVKLDALILQAQTNGEEWIEVEQELIDCVNPRGLFGAKYFTTGAKAGSGLPVVNVCLIGTLDAILREHSIQEGQRVFGPTEGIVNG